MNKVLAVLLLAVTLSVVTAAPALAGSSTDAALALGAFAVFNQLITGQTVFHHGFGPQYVVREPVIVQQPPTVLYAPPPQVIYVPPPVVVYPNGYAYGPPPYYQYYRHHWRHHHDDDDD
jgi:hypothetical protein